MSEWISVKDRMPTREGDYLVYFKFVDPVEAEFNRITDAFYSEKSARFLESKSGASITHWMPLPEPPRGE